MAETKIISDIYKIDRSTSAVYNFLSDFNKLGLLYDKLSNISEQELAMMSQQAGATGSGNMAEDLAKFKEGLSMIEHFEATNDSCSFVVKGIDLIFRIEERESNKMIKIVGEGKMPIKPKFWIQLIDKGPYDTRIRLTLHFTMNMMFKMMIKMKFKKQLSDENIKEGLNKLAQGLTRLPYM